MSVFLSVAGIELRVFENNASEEPAELKGSLVRLDDNTAQSSQRSPKRAFACVAKFDPPSTYDTFLAAISVAGQPGVATPVTVSSDADGLTRGASLSMYVMAGKIQQKTKGAGIFKTTTLAVPLAFREV